MVEVKTTDAYTISLEKILGYRSALIKDGKVSEDSSVLIVVGRKDTDSLEAQVRGSRYGWDTRLISADKLLKLVEIKEAADNKETIRKIRTVLTPLELTRVDFIVDLLATTADDISEVMSTEEDPETPEATDKKEKKFTPVAFHGEVVARLQKSLGVELKKETRALYVSADKSVSARTVVSKTHVNGPNTGYWFAFHPYYRDELEEYKQSFIAFGCGGPETILLFDLAKFVELLPKLNTTELDDRMYWHVHFIADERGKIELKFKGGQPPLVRGARIRRYANSDRPRTIDAHADARGPYFADAGAWRQRKHSRDRFRRRLPDCLSESSRSAHNQSRDTR